MTKCFDAEIQCFSRIHINWGLEYSIVFEKNDVAHNF